MNKRSNLPELTVDLEKRKTLIGASGIAVGGLLATSPWWAPASAAVTSPQNAVASTAGHPSIAPIIADVQISLISIPKADHASLKLVNLTDRPIIIEQFRANNVVFDGESIDCNLACAQNSLVLPAQGDELLQFSHQPTSELNVTTEATLEKTLGEYLLVDDLVYRLPAGTRVINLLASMMDNGTAILMRPSSATLPATLA